MHLQRPRLRPRVTSTAVPQSIHYTQRHPREDRLGPGSTPTASDSQPTPRWPTSLRADTADGAGSTGQTPEPLGWCPVSSNPRHTSWDGAGRRAASVVVTPWLALPANHGRAVSRPLTVSHGRRQPWRDLLAVEPSRAHSRRGSGRRVRLATAGPQGSPVRCQKIFLGARL